MIAGCHSLPRANLDTRLSGGEISEDFRAQYDTWAWRARFGWSVGNARNSFVALDTITNTGYRAFVFSELGISATQRGTSASVSESLAASTTNGRSFAGEVRRQVVTAGLSAGGFGLPPVAVSALWGDVNSDAAIFEHFSLGGGPSTILDRSELAQRITMPVLPSGISTGSSVVTFRGAVGGAPLSLYYWAGSTSARYDRFDTWQRVIGINWSMSVGAIAPAGTPAARAQFGVGESLNEPFRKRLRAYASLILNP